MGTIDGVTRTKSGYHLIEHKPAKAPAKPPSGSLLCRSRPEPERMGDIFSVISAMVVPLLHTSSWVESMSVERLTTPTPLWKKLLRDSDDQAAHG